VLTLILALSVLLRVGVALYLGDQVPRKQDDYSYSQLAARLADGHGFSFGQSWYPFTPADTPTAHWSFLYTAFLAGIYALFGVKPLIARLIGAVLGGLLLPWMVYRLARKVTQTEDKETGREGEGERGRRREERSIVGRPSSIVTSLSEAQAIALLAAGIAAIYAYFILYAARLVTETFYILALLWALERALALSAERQHRLLTAVQLGLALGVAALLRQSILPWVPVLFLWLLWRMGNSEWRIANGEWRTANGEWGMANGESVLRRPSSFACPERSRGIFRLSSIVHRPSSIVALLVAGLVLMACILPFTIRNYVVYGEFLLLNSNAGYAMYSAQHPMHGTVFREHSAAPLPEDLRGQGLGEPALDRELMQRGIGFILDEPGRYLLLSLSRVEDYFRFWPTADSSLLYNVGRVASFGLFLPFMIYGIVLAVQGTAVVQRTAAVRHRLSTVFRRSSVSLLLLFMGFYSLLHVLTWAMIRYRLPVDAVALPFAALAIERMSDRASQR
jgi:hypothetical protein